MLCKANGIFTIKFGSHKEQKKHKEKRKQKQEKLRNREKQKPRRVL